MGRIEVIGDDVGGDRGDIEKTHRVIVKTFSDWTTSFYKARP